MTAALRLTLVRDEDELEELRTAWNELFARAKLATPYQSWAWLSSWWAHYGKSGRLRILTVRDGDDLVGLLPLHLTGRGVNRHLALLGGAVSDFLDGLAVTDREDEVATALVAYLRPRCRWTPLDLQEVRENSLIRRMAALWDGLCDETTTSVCPAMPVRPWDEVLTDLSRKRRETARKTVRRTEGDGLKWSATDPDPDAVNRWVELHHTAWRGRRITPEHRSARFAAHLRVAAKRVAADGCGQLFFLGDGSEVHGADLVLSCRGFVTGYISGSSDHLRGRFEVNTLLVKLWLEEALRRDVPMVTMGRGVEPYKLSWCTIFEENRRVVLGARSPLAFMRVIHHRVRARATRSERLRDLRHRLRDAVDRVRSWRSATPTGSVRRLP